MVGAIDQGTSLSVAGKYLGEDRQAAIHRYRFSVEQALARANLLRSQNLTLLHVFGGPRHQTLREPAQHISATTGKICIGHYMPSDGLRKSMFLPESCGAPLRQQSTAKYE
jgi:hypothetical protein